MIADRRRTKRHQPSGAIAAENNCPEVTKVVFSRATTRKGDAVPVSSRVSLEEAAHRLRKAKGASCRATQ